MDKIELSRRNTIIGAGAGLLAAGLGHSALAAPNKTSKGNPNMTTDLTGGLDPAREYVMTERKVEDGLQEGVNWWLWDDAGEFGMPRLAVEFVSPQWDTHQIQLNFFEPNGHVLRNWSDNPTHPKIGPSGKATHFGAGPLSFDCIEPFRRYRAQFDGDAMSGTFDEAARPGFKSDKREPLKFVIDCETAVPPWVQGTMSTDAAKRMAEKTVEGEFMGGERLEQLCRVSGKITFGGKERDFKGGALRIRRRGVRKITGFWGHCWQSAVFPSGKAFGYIAYPPRPDGQPSYNEGFVFLGEGELIPARVVEAPWLTHLQFKGEEVGPVLETADGKRYKIGGTSFGGMPSIGAIESNFPPLLQSIVHYEWDGEKAYGMMERSNLPEKVKMPA
jgi:hypothetical protein